MSHTFKVTITPEAGSTEAAQTDSAMDSLLSEFKEMQTRVEILERRAAQSLNDAEELRSHNKASKKQAARSEAHSEAIISELQTSNELLKSQAEQQAASISELQNRDKAREEQTVKMTLKLAIAIVQSQIQLQAFNTHLRHPKEPSRYPAYKFKKEKVEEDLVPRIPDEDLFEMAFQNLKDKGAIHQSSKDIGWYVLSALLPDPNPR